jgi:hypothetical protein
MKQIKVKEQPKGRNHMEHHNEEKSDSSSVSASIPDLECSTSENEGEDYFEHDNVFPSDSISTLNVVKYTELQVKKYLQYFWIILVLKLIFHIFLFLVKDNSLSMLRRQNSSSGGAAG